MPKTCTGLAKNCGSVSDGCGAVLNCGTCTAPETCAGAGVANVCGQGACTPKTCAQLGKNCGAVSDTCGGSLQCGSCTAPQTCGGGGTPNVCGQGACVPKTCAQLVKNCGAVSDGCGNTLDCGACTAPQTCGGAGTANVCGAICAVTCPQGYSCNTSGICAGGNPLNLVLNVVVPPQHNVAGTVTMNGANPGVTACYSGYTRAELAFDHTTDTRYSTSLWVQGCTVPSDAYSFTGKLYPGTYKVTVRRGSYGSASNLPAWDTVVNAAFTVSGPSSGIVFNLVVPPLHAVSGTVTMNGANPGVTACYSGYTRAELAFEHTTDTRYSKSLWVQGCTVPSDAYAFTGTLYPGTYKVTVRRGSYGSASNLPDWDTVVNTAFTVSGPRSGIVFNLVVPPLHAVSGTVTMNGANPGVTACY
ncbi:MAG: hypothetical protein ACYC8T_31900, partial [Myxococcaceae bacterium]